MGCRSCLVQESMGPMHTPRVRWAHGLLYQTATTARGLRRRQHQCRSTMEQLQRSGGGKNQASFSTRLDDQRTSPMRWTSSTLEIHPQLVVSGKLVGRWCNLLEMQMISQSSERRFFMMKQFFKV